MTYYCLDLFAGLGGFSQAFQNHPDWEVVTVDITDTYTVETENGLTQQEVDHDYVCDILDLTAADFIHQFDLVVASPPCTTFSLAAISHHRHADDWGYPKTSKAAKHEQLLYHLYNLIEALAPTYWVVENPMAKMRKMPPFGEPTGTITFCQFGEDRRKPTDLWGRLPPGFEFRSCPNGADCHESAPRGSNTGTQGLSSSAESAKLPLEFSQHLCQKVTAALEGSTKTTDAVSQEHYVEPPEYKSYCEYCGRRRAPDGKHCTECGSSLTSNSHVSLHRCRNGHYSYIFTPGSTTEPLSTSDCQWCALKAEIRTGEPSWTYTLWHDKIAHVAKPPNRVDSHGRLTYAVPQNFEKIPGGITDEVVVEKVDVTVCRYVNAAAYYHRESDEIFIAAKEIDEELFAPENPRLPRQPMTEQERHRQQHGAGLDAFMDNDSQKEEESTYDHQLLEDLGLIRS